MIQYLATAVDQKGPTQYNCSMQLIKLNRRFRACREHGHTIALEFSGFDIQSSVIEGRMMMAFGSQYKDQPEWRSWFGRLNGRRGCRPYYISMLDESHLTLLMLMHGNDFDQIVRNGQLCYN